MKKTIILLIAVLMMALNTVTVNAEIFSFKYLVMEKVVRATDTLNIEPIPIIPAVEMDEEEIVYNNYEYTEEEIYELAKIIMCEAEGESQKCKEYVGQVVLNRIEADEFPDNIHDVIWQTNQFSPTFDGRWEEVEPNKECYDAAYTVINAIEPLTNALYFEACNGDSWHSRNLTMVAELSNTRFYVE